MPPPDETDSEQRDRDEPKEPERVAEEEPRGDPPPSDVGAPQTLSFLFLAAAGSLVLLLAIVALLAFAAMSR